MKIAYSISIHKSPEQFRRLFRSIYHPANHYLVHVDRKSNAALMSGVASFLKEYPNASLLVPNQFCSYSGFGLLKVRLRAIGRFLATASDWSFYISLGGQDFPLMSQAAIMEHLENFQGKNFLEVFDQLSERPETLRRIRYFYIDLKWRGKIQRLPWLRRSFPKGMTPYQGSACVILSRKFCEHLLSAPACRKLERFYRFSRSPDEGYFQSAIMNGPFRDTVQKSDLRFIKWKDGNQHPEILTMNELPAMLESKKLFARKFDSSVDDEVIRVLEERVLA